MRKRFLIVGLVLLVIAGGFWFTSAFQPAKAPGNTAAANMAAETGVTVGKIAPQFSLKDMAGKPVTVGAGGKITVINFWATWCPPCREELPQLQKFAQALPADVVFYAVNIQESPEKVGAFLDQNHYDLPVLLDSGGSVASTFRINAVPTTIIADKEGKIRFRKSGGVTQAELENIIKGL